MRRPFPLALAALALAAGLAVAEPPPLLTAHGTVDKVAKDTLTIRTRGPEGRFGTNLVLRVTGTSKLTTLAPQKRGRRVVVTQRDTDLKELQRNQAIAVVYTTAGKDSVLLAGVAQPAGDK